MPTFRVTRIESILISVDIETDEPLPEESNSEEAREYFNDIIQKAIDSENWKEESLGTERCLVYHVTSPFDEPDLVYNEDSVDDEDDADDVGEGDLPYDDEDDKTEEDET